MLKMSDYRIETLLGSGSFGKVKLARRRKDSTILCVKTMKKAQIMEAKQTDHIINECEIISQIKHPMIVQIISLRWVSKESAKTKSICISSWNMCQEANFSAIFAKKVALTLLRLGKFALTQILCIANCPSIRVSAPKRRYLPRFET